MGCSLVSLGILLDLAVRQMFHHFLELGGRLAWSVCSLLRVARFVELFFLLLERHHDHFVRLLQSGKCLLQFAVFRLEITSTTTSTTTTSAAAALDRLKEDNLDRRLDFGRRHARESTMRWESGWLGTCARTNEW
jgi:hypothetical protein